MFAFLEKKQETIFALLSNKLDILVSKKSWPVSRSVCKVNTTYTE